MSKKEKENEFALSVPEGCAHLYGSLFSVPFAMLRTPDSVDVKDNEYKFVNPRLLTESGANDLLDKRLSADLRENIKHKTLLNPLICRWVKDGDSYYPLIVGGDRRYRALDYLISKKELVADPRSVELDDKGNWISKQCSANEVYETVLCQVFAVNDDLDALALAWAENKSRINLTEGHEIAEVMKLRKIHTSDEKILEILQRDEKWLSQTDSLIANLDEETLADLLENRIDRESACALGKIEDKELRQKIRVAANAATSETCNRKIKRLQKQVESALDSKEIAEGSVAVAEFNNDEDAVDEARNELSVAEKKVKKIVKERDQISPLTAVKDIKKAAAASSYVEREDDDKPLRILSARKIQNGLDYIDNLIENDGNCEDEEGTFIVPINHLKLVRRIINNNVLANESNFTDTMRRHSIDIGE